MKKGKKRQGEKGKKRQLWLLKGRGGVQSPFQMWEVVSKKNYIPAGEKERDDHEGEKGRIFLVRVKRRRQGLSQGERNSFSPRSAVLGRNCSSLTSLIS